MSEDPKARKEISEEFFYGQVDKIAQNLLGKLLVRESGEGVAGGIIVETEAYLGREDPASHLVNAGEKRQKVFDKGAGTVYVFKIYRHHNMNFITEYNGHPEGVLIRAVEPFKNEGIMRERRGVEEKELVGSGPGRLTEAMDINKEQDNGVKISESRISVFETNLEPEIEVSRRIGISRAEDWPLRFTVRDNAHVSKPLNTDTKSGFDPDKFYRFLEDGKKPDSRI